MGRIVGLDLGARWIGVASTDETGTVVFPREPWEIRDTEDVIRNLEDLLKAEQIDTIVIGVPEGMRGSETQQTTTIKEMVDAISAALPVPVATYDERLTSKLADTLLQSAPKSKKMSHSVAAQQMLEDYLTHKRN